MVYVLAISIFFLPVVTASGEEFWDDVDKIYNDLSNPEDLPTQATYHDLSDAEDSPTQATISEEQVVEPTFDAPQHTVSSDKKEESSSKRPESAVGRFFPKYITINATGVEIFKQTIIIDESYPQNMSFTEVEEKLLELGISHEWDLLKIYDIDKYLKYWAKVCVYFQNEPMNNMHRHACVISRSLANNKKRKIQTRNKKQFLDLLYCKCHRYENSSRIPLFTPQPFLVHKGSENEFFLFEEKVTQDNKSELFIKDFKGGITLPKPVAGEQSRCTISRVYEKYKTIGALDMKLFIEVVKIDKSYPKNISLMALERKLQKPQGINHWPHLHKYNVLTYANYWIRVCMYFWGKKLDHDQRQACIIMPSFAINTKRKLFLSNGARTLDLLSCKCHSYTTNYKVPVSAAETFLIHQGGANEFFVFDQQTTPHCHYTLFIKNFIGGVTLPDPEDFK